MNIVTNPSGSSWNPNTDSNISERNLANANAYNASTPKPPTDPSVVQFADPSVSKASAPQEIFFGDASPLEDGGIQQGMEHGMGRPGKADTIMQLLEILQMIIALMAQLTGKSMGSDQPSLNDHTGTPPSPTGGSESHGKATGGCSDAGHHVGGSDGGAGSSSATGNSTGASSSGGADSSSATGSSTGASSSGGADSSSATGSSTGASSSSGAGSSSATGNSAGASSTGGPTLEGGPAAGGGSKADRMDIRGTRGDDYHYKNNGGTETFTVSNTDKPSGEPYDPRSEAAFRSETFKAGDDVKTFSGNFTVESGDDTTIAQILNHDENASDKHVPSAFITYEDGALYQGHKDSGKKLADIAPGEEFELTMKSNGKSTDIYVNGEHVDTVDGGRQSGENYFKYGAYHHGGKDDDSVENKAVIHARDVTVS